MTEPTQDEVLVTPTQLAHESPMAFSPKQK